MHCVAFLRAARTPFPQEPLEYLDKQQHLEAIERNLYGQSLRRCRDSLPIPAATVEVLCAVFLARRTRLQVQLFGTCAVILESSVYMMQTIQLFEVD